MKRSITQRISKELDQTIREQQETMKCTYIEASREIAKKTKFRL